MALLAATWASAARFEKAAELYRRIPARQPDHIQALDGLARAAGWIGAREEALAAGRRALESKDHAVRAQPPVW
ncbi:MAG: tetratricopeptide repeat protein, partial [Proteobacteria bacterium]|nr:tetratricopeptide repeat protein [Pseudomonadota bacterium]